ncbi:MAG TPA: hypothetical protein VIC08_01635, partial [Cellvibrionaceae bacterium]
MGKLVVVGIGLIGGSLAAALKLRSACDEVIAVVRSRATGEQALRHGVADRTCLSIAEIAPELTRGDVIFIAVPALIVVAVWLVTYAVRLVRSGAGAVDWWGVAL